MRVLDKELKGDGNIRDMMIATAACNGYDGMGRVIGKKGVKHTVIRFVHHAVATVDAVIYARSPILRNRSSSALGQEMYYISDSYHKLTPPSGKKHKGPLTESERGMANAYCLENMLGLDVPDDDMTYFAQHYAAIEPVLGIVIDRDDMSRALVDNIIGSHTASLTEGVL